MAKKLALDCWSIRMRLMPWLKPVCELMTEESVAFDLRICLIWYLHSFKRLIADCSEMLKP